MEVEFPTVLRPWQRDFLFRQGQTKYGISVHAEIAADMAFKSWLGLGNASPFDMNFMTLASQCEKITHNEVMLRYKSGTAFLHVGINGGLNTSTPSTDLVYELYRLFLRGQFKTEKAKIKLTCIWEGEVDLETYNKLNGSITSTLDFLCDRHEDVLKEITIEQP